MSVQLTEIRVLKKHVFDVFHGFFPSFNSFHHDPGRREKNKLKFFIPLLFDASKDFMKTLKAFIKP